MIPTVPGPEMSVKSRIGAGVVGLAIALAATLVTGFEGSRLHAYQDGVGQWTICEGHSRGVKRGDYATIEQCNQYKRDDLARAASAIQGCLLASLTPNEYAAFLDFEFNTGRFCGSSIARLADAGKIKEACKAIGLYMYVGGRDCRIKSSNCSGIVRRRNAEMSLCWPNLSGVESGAQTWPKS